jgi:hypothetical protein
MRATGLLVLAALLGAALAGCAEKETSVDSKEGPGAAGADLGSIGGLVVDDERRAVPDASVELVELSRSEQADGGGRFVFLKVPSGEYTLHASANGFRPQDLKVRIEPGENAVVRLEVAALPSPVAHVETDHYTALISCMVYTAYYFTHCSSPYTAAYETARSEGVNLSTLGAPQDPLSNNYRHNFSARADNTGIVSELIWKPNADATKYMWLTLTCPWYDPITDACIGPQGRAANNTQAEPVVYAHRRGPSPLRVEWQHPRPTWLPWVMSKATLTGDIDTYAGAAVDQRLEMYNSVFYGGSVPHNWSILDAS